MKSDVNIQQINELKDNVSTLYKTVYQGNGTPSLINQVTKLEHRICSLEDKLEQSFTSIDTEMTLKFKNITDVVNERFNNISYQIANEFEKKRTEQGYKWNFKTSVFTAFVAGIGSLLTIVVTEVFKRI
jgi:hypothetical protein